MFSNFVRWFAGKESKGLRRRSAAGQKQRHSQTRRAAIEPLELRQLLSATPLSTAVIGNSNVAGNRYIVPLTANTSLSSTTAAKVTPSNVSTQTSTQVSTPQSNTSNTTTAKVTPANVVKAASASAGAVAVNGVAPLSGTEGQPIASQTLATFLDAGGPGDLGNYTATINWGDGTTSPGTIVTGASSGGEADVLLLTDTTGSMGGYLSFMQSALAGIVSAISADLPGVNVEYAVADYRDYPDGGNYATQGLNLDQPFTTNTAAVQNAISSLTANGGDDWPEEDLNALYCSATNWLSTSGSAAFDGRAGAQKILVWAGDAPGHYYGETGADGPSTFFQSIDGTVSALKSAGVQVIGLDMLAQDDGIDTNYGGQNQEEYITGATGGVSLYNLEYGAAGSAQAVVNSVTTVTTTTFMVQGGHTYAEEGNYPITITVNDLGVPSEGTTSAQIADVPLTSVTGAAVTATAGDSTGPVTVATFVDGGNPSNALQSDYSATINWGDGMLPAPAASCTTASTTSGTCRAVTPMPRPAATQSA